jgi:HD-GYP domain-containing protein (c-di-GMP phosphodiesterase class II)
VRLIDEARLDAVAAAFADVVGTKSPYTSRHSREVARYAHGIAARLGCDDGACRRLRRAGLLHDLGKLAVSNRILDKNGPLTEAERAAVQRHPAYTWDILSRVSAFDDIAWTAAIHHERLDGRGYPWGLRAEALDLPARILAAADVYEALTADRPYRRGLSPERALAIVGEDVGTHLDADVVAALAGWVREDEGAEGEAAPVYGPTCGLPSFPPP